MVKLLILLEAGFFYSAITYSKIVGEKSNH